MKSEAVSIEFTEMLKCLRVSNNGSVCNEELQKLRQAMAQLPYEQREVMLLHLQAAMTFKTIARVLALSADTVKSRYRYGLRKLRLILDDEVKK